MLSTLEKLKRLPVLHVPLVCGRVSDPHRRSVIGSEICRCYNCNERVFVSPGSRQSAERTVDETNSLDYTIVCLDCMVEYAKLEEAALGQKPRYMPPSSMQINERPGILAEYLFFKVDTHGN